MKIFSGLKVLYISKYDYNVDYIGWCLIDALEYFGATIYCCDPKIKWQTKQFINDYGVNIIFVDAQHGIDRLPIQLINDKNVCVFVLHDDSIDLEINNKININKKSLSFFGNIFAKPDRKIDNDITLVFNNDNQPLLINKWIIPLTNRVLFLGKSIKIFGCDLLRQFNLPFYGKFPLYNQELINLFGNSKMYINIVDENETNNQTIIHGAFCGGFPINNFDHPAMKGTSNVTDFIQLIEHYLNNDDVLYNDKKTIIDSKFFEQSNIDLLRRIFENCNHEVSKDILYKENKRLAVKHLFELEAMGLYE